MRGCFSHIDSDRILGSQCFIQGAAPRHLRSLPLRQFHMGIHQAVKNVGRSVASENFAIVRKDSITQADQIISHVDCRRRVILSVQSLASVSVKVVILNVVMHQRGLMKDFDRDECSFDGIARGERRTVGTPFVPLLRQAW